MRFTNKNGQRQTYRNSLLSWVLKVNGLLRKEFGAFEAKRVKNAVYFWTVNPYQSGHGEGVGTELGLNNVLSSSKRHGEVWTLSWVMGTCLELTMGWNDLEHNRHKDGKE